MDVSATPSFTSSGAVSRKRPTGVVMDNSYLPAERPENAKMPAAEVRADTVVPPARKCRLMVASESGVPEELRRVPLQEECPGTANAGRANGIRSRILRIHP